VKVIPALFIDDERYPPDSPKILYGNPACPPRAWDWPQLREYLSKMDGIDAASLMSAKAFLTDQKCYLTLGEHIWVWQRAVSSQAAIEQLQQTGCPGLISFDHDLGGDDTARTVVQWMINQDLDTGFIPDDFEFRVHSQNPVGAQFIQQTLTRYLAFRAQEKQVVLGQHKQPKNTTESLKKGLK